MSDAPVIKFLATTYSVNRIITYRGPTSHKWALVTTNSPIFTMELSLSRSLPGGSTVRVPLHIPMEVLTTICGFASASPINLDMDEMDCLFEDPWRIRAVQRMRLVSKIFNSAASPFLIQQVYLTPNHDSVDRLNNIADSVFGKHVRSVWIDCRLFNEDICSRPADYANALNTTSMFSMYPKEKLRDGFRTYCELAAKQQECCERGLHIDCLVNAFTKMPNLQTAVMSSRHRPWHMRRSYRRLLSFRPPGIPGGNPGQYDYMVEPDAIFFSAEDAQRSTHREKYLTLTSEYLQALSRPAIASRIKSLKVSTLDPSHPMSTFTGVFGGLNHFHTSLKFMFGGLRKLDLSLSRGLLPAIIDPNTDSDDTSAKAWQRLLKDCLGAAQQIKVLSLSFLTYPRDAYRDMTDILGTLPLSFACVR